MVMRECQSCGAAVSHRFVRVFGRDGAAYACGDCESFTAVKQGAAALPDG